MRCRIAHVGRDARLNGPPRNPAPPLLWWPSGRPPRKLDVVIFFFWNGDGMFTQTVEYALRVAVRLAATDPEPQTADDLAMRTRIPRAYLSKVVQAMVRGGVARSKRGVGGGVVLSKSPESVTILEIVNAVDPIKRIDTCPLGLSSHGTRLCPLHRRFDDALAQVEQAFAASTLAEVLDEPDSSVPLCSFPQRRGTPTTCEVGPLPGETSSSAHES